MKRIFLDIETLPPENCGHETCNGRDPCPDEEYRKLALRAEFGRLLCVGVIVEEGHNIIHQGILGRDRTTLRFHLDEERTLRSLWKLFDGFNIGRDLVIGFNLYEFDLLFLYQRSIIHQVRPSVFLSFARYRSAPIYDVMKEWKRWSFSSISLNDLASALNLPSSKTDGIDGSKVYDFYMKNRHVEIADYCLRDVILTREIYYRLQFEECVAKAS
jgi:hypothetical protein